MVYEHLDQFFRENPDWLNEAPDAIAKEIHGAIGKKLRGLPEKERPHLGRTTLRNHVGEYLRRRVK